MTDSEEDDPYTTIRIDKRQKETLDRMKAIPKEPYDAVLARVIEGALMSDYVDENGEMGVDPFDEQVRSIIHEEVDSDVLKEPRSDGD